MLSFLFDTDLLLIKLIPLLTVWPAITFHQHTNSFKKLCARKGLLPTWSLLQHRGFTSDSPLDGATKQPQKLPED